MVLSPLISVIIPVYNVAGYIKSCLDSVICQTYPNLEIILIDDGSTDVSGYICDEYRARDPRIKVVHKGNAGQSSARNVGLEIATGDIIGFVDSDDVIAPDMYEKMLSKLMETGADICTCNISGIDDTGKRIGSDVPFISVSGMIEGKEDFLKAISHRVSQKSISLSVYDKIYKKEVIGKIRFPEGKLHEDAFFLYHFVDLGPKIVGTNERSYFYRQRRDSTVHQKKRIAHLDRSEADVVEAKIFLCEAFFAEAIYSLYGAVAFLTDIRSELPKKDRNVRSRVKELKKEIREVYKKIPRKVKTFLYKGKFFCFFLNIDLFAFIRSRVINRRTN